MAVGMIESRLGRGIYPVPEAARLSPVPAQRIRRWLGGYGYRVRSKRRVSRPAIAADFRGPAGARTLSFLDLIELRFVDAFRSAGVGWAAIRMASDHARDLLHHEHPFATRRFHTDGGTILLEVARSSGEPELLELVARQFAFRKVLAPYLYRDIELGPKEVVARWWPMDRRHQVLIDPDRAFGHPIVDREGVPTATLAAAFRVEGSIERVAGTFEAGEAAVRDAVDFERQITAAA